MAGLNLLDKKAIMKQHPETFEHYKSLLILQLKTVASILEKNNVTWWITGGTLLGFFRDNDIIPQDYDTDIAIAAETMNVQCIKDLMKLASYHIVDDKNKYLVVTEDLLKSFETGGFVPDRNWKFKSNVWLMFGDLKMFPSIDIFPYKKFGDRRWKRVYPERMRWLMDSTLLPVRKFKTRYGIFNVPNDTIEYLRMTYGNDWQTPKYDLDMHRAAKYENRCPRKESGDIRMNMKTKEVKQFPFPNPYENIIYHDK